MFAAALRLSKNRVIASQCSHWRGNPPDFQTFSSLNHRFLRSTGGFPHQSADWFGMTTYLSDFFDTLRAAASICSSPLVRSDPLEIRCPGAKAPGKELASSSRCQGTVHRTVPLNFSNLQTARKQIPKWVSAFLVTRWRFELQTHCLKGSCSTD